MPQYLDQYFSVYNRSSNLAKSFLTKYLPESEDNTKEYIIEEQNDCPRQSFENINSVLAYLELNPNCEYTFYLHSLNKESIIQHAMLFYTNDGGIIYGVSILGRYPEERESLMVYKDLKKFLDSKIGCITSEEPAPNNLTEFLTFAKERFCPNYP
jgi:hypothetical protein